MDLPTTAGLMRLPALALAAGLLIVWLIVAPRTPDLAAAAYRLNLFDHLGFGLYDEHWYAGHLLPGYSLLFPPLASLLGLRFVGALAVLASVACFERLVRDVYGESSRWAAMLFALAAVGDVWIGRLAFALGVSFALAASLAFARNRPLAAGALALLSAAASPVAGALLALAGLSHTLLARSPRALPALALPPLFVVLGQAFLFPEGGAQPYPTLSFLATAGVMALFVAALGRGHRALRVGGVVYLLACLFFLLVSTPMGSNIERYGVLLAGPLLLCAVLSRPGPRITPLALLALCAWGAWAGWGPLRETLAVAGNRSTSAAYYAPVERFLAAHASSPVRLEVPLTRSHWETAELAPRVSLARGWEKQLDARYDSVLLTRGLNAASYERWLREQAVSYVALPDTKLDPSSAGEGALIRRGLPYLREVFANRHWRIYSVSSPTPIASGPGTLTWLGHESFALAAHAPGSFLVRVHYTRYFTVAHGAGACVGSAPGGWTTVLARHPGTVLVRASFSLGRAFGSGSSCGTRRTRGG